MRASMSGFNQPDAPLVRYASVKLAPAEYDKFNERREKMGLTWSKFFRDAAEATYFG